MKFRLEATKEELRTKGPILLKALAEKLRIDLENIEHDHLVKSEVTQIIPRYKVVAEILKQSTEVYSEEIEAMMLEIDEVINGSISDT